MSQYIGKTISLISNKGLRYVGLLDKISAEDATVSLKSVRLFGTEGRMAEQGHPQSEVMPGTDIYEYVVFRGSDVKDLTVLDVPIEEVRPMVYFQPPALATAPSASTTTATHGVAMPGPTPVASAANLRGPSGHNGQNTSEQTTRAPGTDSLAPMPVSASPAQLASVPRETGQVSVAKPAEKQPPVTPTTTYKQAPLKTTSEAPRERAAPVPSQSYDTAFDFEEANKRFEKERLQEGANRSTYDKKSLFFDSISLNERGSSMRWNEEKDLNMDTFGEAYARRGRGGARGNRGGRGRGNGYRGRGRGNYRGRGSSEPKPEWA